MLQKMMFCFTNITAVILHHILGYSFCTERRVLEHLCQMLYLLKAWTLICAKAALLWHQNVGEIDPWRFSVVEDYVSLGRY